MAFEIKLTYLLTTEISRWKRTEAEYTVIADALHARSCTAVYIAEAASISSFFDWIFLAVGRPKLTR